MASTFVRPQDKLVVSGCIFQEMAIELEKSTINKSTCERLTIVFGFGKWSWRWKNFPIYKMELEVSIVRPHTPYVHMMFLWWTTHHKHVTHTFILYCLTPPSLLKCHKVVKPNLVICLQVIFITYMYLSGVWLRMDLKIPNNKIRAQISLLLKFC